jgi:hypothetical protein
VDGGGAVDATNIEQTIPCTWIKGA